MSSFLLVMISQLMPLIQLNLHKKADDLDGEVLVCVIHSSKIVKGGYLLVSRKTMEDVH